MTRDRWFIYGLAEPGSDTVRYVGVTSDMLGRLRQHMSKAKTGGVLPVNAWIRSLGIQPRMMLLEDGVGDDGWREAERRWVALTPNALNVSPGGGELAIPPESRARAGEKLKSRYFSQEHRARISAAKTGKPRADREAIAERNRAMASGRIGVRMKFTEEGLASKRKSGKRFVEAARRYWATASAEERLRRSELAREQMRRVWAERRAARNAR